MTRENKLAMVIGFGLLLFVGILVSDHLSARSTQPPLVAAASLPERSSLPGGRVTPAADPVEFGGRLPSTVTLPPDDGALPIAQGSLLLPPPAPREAIEERAATSPVSPVSPATAVADAARRYTVEEGDNPGRISERFYGRSRYGELLAKHNAVDPRDLRIGQVLEIPPLSVLDPSAPAAPTPAATAIARGEPSRDTAPAAQRFRTVTVGEGDTLYQIARRVYGDGTRWEEIARLNGVNAKGLRPGMELRYALAD